MARKLLYKVFQIFMVRTDSLYTALSAQLTSPHLIAPSAAHSHDWASCDGRRPLNTPYPLRTGPGPLQQAAKAHSTQRSVSRFAQGLASYFFNHNKAAHNFAPHSI